MQKYDIIFIIIYWICNIYLLKFPYSHLVSCFVLFYKILLNTFCHLGILSAHWSKGEQFLFSYPTTAYWPFFSYWNGLNENRIICKMKSDSHLEIHWSLKHCDANQATSHSHHSKAQSYTGRSDLFTKQIKFCYSLNDNNLYTSLSTCLENPKVANIEQKQKHQQTQQFFSYFYWNVFSHVLPASGLENNNSDLLF